LSTFWFISDDLNHDTVFVYALQKSLTRYIQFTLPSRVVKKTDPKKPTRFFRKAHLKNPNKTYQKNTVYFSFEISSKKYKIKSAGHSYSYL